MVKSVQLRISFIVILFFLTVNFISAQTSIKDETRFPVGTAGDGFIQDWLVLGSFPNQDNKAYDTDFLQDDGGELKIKPELGRSHKLANGKEIKWRNYHSPYNYVNIFDVLREGEFTNQVIYAYTKVNRENSGKVVLSFAQNNNNKLWVNSRLIYESKTDNQAAMEDNQIEVELNKGENSVLIKTVHNGWTWGFTFRVIEPDQFSLIHDFKLTPNIVKTKDNLVVKTDRSLNPEIQKFDVDVKVVAPGGKIVAEKKSKRGEQVSFDAKKWQDGVYDICFRSHDTRGKVQTAYLYWFKGDLVKKVKEVISTAPQNPKNIDEYHHLMLSQMITERFKFNPEKIDSTIFPSVCSPLMEYEELLLDKAGKKGSVRANGFVRLKYIDEVDGTPQFCRAFLPLNYNSKQKWPLVVMLHGYNGENPIYVNWWSIDLRHSNVVDKFPVIYLEPHGRGNTSYRGIGDQDILKIIELAKKQFNIDDDRVYLKGESMGGGGTWNVGTRHPGLFAAIAPVFGGWDYHVGMSEQAIAKLSEKEKYDNEVSSNLVQADALLTTPAFVIHGDIDKAVDVSNSRYLVKAMQRWGYDIRYHEYPGFGHEGIEYYDELIPWFLEHKRNNDPEKVRVRSAELKYASANWVKVTQLDKPNKFITAEAEVLVNNTIKLSTENVLEIELTPSSKLIDPKKPVKVIWNVSDIRDTKVAAGKILLQDKNYKPLPLHKNPKIAGMISDITTTPFAVVIGTISKDSLMKKIIKNKAQDFINYWKNWQKYEPRIFKDTELTDADMKKYSLILYGSAEANLVTQKLGDKLPIKVSADEIELAGKKFQAKDAYFQMIYPHPLNSERYVAVIGATSGSGLFFYNNSTPNYDFEIQDGCIPIGHLGRTKEKLSIANGFFDNNWQVDEKLMKVGDSELRRTNPVKKILPDFSTKIENIPALDTNVCKKSVGKYLIQGTTKIEVKYENGKMFVIAPNGNKLSLYPLSSTEYFLDVEDVQVVINSDTNGVVTGGTVYQQGQEMVMKKIE